jgi:DNA helicase II / ATP-dependent DNA helicase PcrA
MPTKNNTKKQLKTMEKTKEGLNPDQLTAVQHETGPLLVVAGAGTGKTRVITERIKHLVTNKDINPQEILALTFTDKASGEMLNRIGDVMPLGYTEPWVYTFHSFADRILRAEGLEIGIDPSYKLLSSSEQWILLRKNIFKLNIEYFRPLGNPTKFISNVLKFISRLQDENISPKDLLAFVDQQKNNSDPNEAKRWHELAHVYEKYQDLKIQNSKMDFGDLITWTIRLFEQRPNILKKYQKQFKHMLVDEFQDTNYSQYMLVKQLFPNLDDFGERSLMVVGDDSQSIYKFRGAAVSNILEFMKDFPSSSMVTLLENYRSSQNVLDPAYKLIQNNNPDTLESKLGISKELVSKKTEPGFDPQIILLNSLEDEVEYVVSQIYDILAKEPQYTYKDFAILARANSHLDPFLLGLRQHGIPYQLVGNRGLYDRDEVRDVIALLNVVVNPNDPISLYRVLNIETLEIPFDEISRTLSSAKYQKKDLWEVLQASKNEFVQNFIKMVTDAQRSITKDAPVEFTYNLVKTINYLDQFTNEETIENQLAIQNLDIFLNIIKKFQIEFHQENKEYPTVIDLLEYLDLTLEAGENPAQSEIEDIDTVNLMTVHSSKGLEYPVVFIVNTVADRFPTRNRSDTIEIPTELIKETLPTGDEHVQEERRLFYVAMTRAKKYLYITLAKNYGGKRDKTPSGFLHETELPITNIDKALIEKHNQDTLFGKTSGFREPKATKITNFAPDFLSYSQIDTYLNCALQYKYRYILKIPSLPSHALSFGTTIHDTLRDFHQKLMFDHKADVTDLLKMYEKNWQPLGYLDEEHRKTRFEDGKKLLERYYEKTKDQHPQYVELEKSFNIKIDGIRFYGRIDRIDHIDGEGEKSVEIIDYKTGQPKSQKDVDNDMQVAIYAIGAKEGLGYEPKLLSLHYLEADQKMTTTRTPEQLEKTKEKLKETVGKIKSGNFDPNPGMLCNWCDFRNICPFAYKG